MIDAAKKSGADFVKFQIWNPDNLKKGDWDMTMVEEKYIIKAFFNKKKFKILFNYSKKKKIKCFASIFADRIKKRLFKCYQSNDKDTLT